MRRIVLFLVLVVALMPWSVMAQGVVGLREVTNLAEMGIQPKVGERVVIRDGTTYRWLSSDYLVSRGDTVWDLSEIYRNDPYRYSEIVEANDLQMEVRSPDDVFVLIRENGHILHGLLPEEIGGLGENLSPRVVVAEEAPVANTEEFGLFSRFLGWLPWLVVLAFLFLILFWFIRELNEGSTSPTPSRRHHSHRRRSPLRGFSRGYPREGINPATAVVNGGIRGSHEAGNMALRAASSEFSRSTGFTFPMDRYEIISQVHGRGTGTLRIEERGGRTPWTRVKDEPVWLSRVRLPNGLERTLLTFDTCGNMGIYSSGSDFKFIPDEGQKPVVEPTTPQRPVAVETSRQQIKAMEGDLIVKFCDDGAVVVMDKGGQPVLTVHNGDIQEAELGLKELRRVLEISNPTVGRSDEETG